MPTDNQRLNNSSLLALWIGIAGIKTCRPQDDSLVLSCQWQQLHNGHIVVHRQRRLFEAVGEQQVGFVNRQQLLAQNRSVLQGQSANTANQSVRLAILDNAFRNRRVPLADLAELLQHIPDTTGFAVNEGAILNFCHGLKPLSVVMLQM
ncbi:hypothetical protein D3C76_1127030 [compost metagenome]